MSDEPLSAPHNSEHDPSGPSRFAIAGPVVDTPARDKREPLNVWSAKPRARRDESRSDIRGRLRQLLPTSNARAAEDISALDGLRGLAILLVLVCHSDAYSAAYGSPWPSLFHMLAGYAYTGVILFFILSGFLLFLPYARGLVASRRWPNVRTFYVRRVLRILPIYYAALLLTILATAHTGGWNAVTQIGKNQLALSATLLFGLNSKAFFFATGMDGPLWSLTIEWQFYLVLPWIALLLAFLVGSQGGQSIEEQPARLRRLAFALGGLVAFGLGARAVAAVAHYSWGYAVPTDAGGVRGLVVALLYGMQGKYLEVFALGMLGSVIYVVVVERAILSRPAAQRLGQALIMLCLFGLVVIFPWALSVNRLFGWGTWVGFFPAQSDWPWIVFGEPALGVAYAACLLGVLFLPEIGSIFAWAPLRFVGTISYSMYVWHTLLLAALLNHGVSDWLAVLWSAVAGPAASPTLLTPPTAPRLLLLWLLILVVSTASYFAIERPFLRLRYRVRANASVAPAPVPSLSR